MINYKKKEVSNCKRAQQLHLQFDTSFVYLDKKPFWQTRLHLHSIKKVSTAMVLCGPYRNF